MDLTMQLPVYGISGAVSYQDMTGSVADGGDRPDAFGRLVSIYQSNAYLLSELSALRSKLADAKAFAAKPGINPSLAKALLLRLKTRHAAALRLLRANRVAARDLLTGIESDRLKSSFSYPV
jgi:hypothetical protein